MFSRTIAITGIGSTLASTALLALAASPASATNACSAGATLVSDGICEVAFTSGSHTFTPPAGITKLDALVVGAGGAGSADNTYPDAYGGGGGDVKLVTLTASGDVTVSVGVAGVHGTATSSANDSSVAQGGVTTTATAGTNAGNDGSAGHSGNNNDGNGGYCASTVCLGGGGGAGARPEWSVEGSLLGGAGVVVNTLSGASTGLFATDTTCFGGGGSASGFRSQNSGATNGMRNGASVCGGGSGTFVAASVNGPYVSHSLTVPRANSGSGGTGLVYKNDDDQSVNVRVSQSGAAGYVALRFDATVPQPLPNTGANSATLLAATGFGFAAVAAGSGALLLLKRRKTVR